MRRNAIKLSLLLLLVLPVVLFFACGLHHYVTLEAIKSQLVTAREYYQQHPLLTILIFGAADMAVAAFSIPIATLMTLSSGALFDFWTALVVVSIASNFGATVPFLIARYVAHDFVEKRFSKKLAVIQRGIEREGAFYLFALRLTPLFPFWLVNLLMGLTPMRTATYFWVTLVGTMPGRILYIFAGQQLSQIESLRDIASPSLLLAFTALGLFPLLARKIVQRFRTARTAS